MAFADCFLPIAHKKQVPFGYLSPASNFPIGQEAMGNRHPMSFVPFPMFPFTDRMAFFERVLNVLGASFSAVLQHIADRNADLVAREFFGPGIPSVAELRTNASLAIINTGLGLTEPTPVMPGVVEAGGMHCGPARPLSKVITIVILFCKALGCP